MIDLPNTPDSTNVIGSIREFPNQCEQTLKDIENLDLSGNYSQINNLVICGMGGSALGGRVLLSLQHSLLKVPLIVSTEYNLPYFVNNNTLVIASSYSGNTDETLFSLNEALSKKAKIISITTGNKLGDLSDQLDIPHFIIRPDHNPSNQPRMALGYSIYATLAILKRCGLVNPETNLSSIPEFLISRQNREQELLELSSNFVRKIPVIVASEFLKGAAHCVKNQINENAKNFADLYDLPELNHHLLEGLTFPKTNPQNLAFLFCISSGYRHQLKIRYPLTRQVIEKNGIPTYDLQVEGDSELTQAMDLIQSGSYMAYYLAMLNGVDPGPIPWVDWYKDEIRKVV
jgi:glucose/mannose-6-phosphate isomerase